MKKKLLFAFVGAIALSGAVGITSCSSSDDVADVNPFFDSETNSVKTQFVLNIARQPYRQEAKISAALTTLYFLPSRQVERALLMPLLLLPLQPIDMT